MAILSLVACLCLGATKATSTTHKPRRAHVVHQRHVKVPKRSKIAKKCDSLTSAIVFYRQTTWERQDQLGVARSVTFFPEKADGRCAYKKFVVGRWQDQAGKLRQLLESLGDPAVAIRYVFGGYADQAIAVSKCESGLRTTAVNGQYLGLFQMGDYARELYGHSSDALGQARSAYHYFMASGHDWSPWSCKPW